MNITNIWLAVLDQGPWRRLLRNLITGRILSVLHINAHVAQGSGQPKVAYGSKESALKAANAMSRKTGAVFSTYKCFRCPGYHIGRNSARTVI